MFFSTKGLPIELPEIHETVFRRLEDENNSYINLSKKIPKQLPKGGVHEFLMNALAFVGEGSKLALIGNFLLNVSISGPLS